MSADPRPPMSSRLRGFWLLSAAVGLAVLAAAATLVKAELQLRWLEAFVEQDGASSARARADQALDQWGHAWLDTWLRDRNLAPGAAAGLVPCVQDLLYALDEVSVSVNVVRFEVLQGGRVAAETCAADFMDPEQAQAFARALELRWGTFLEQRSDRSPGRPVRPGG